MKKYIIFLLVLVSAISTLSQTKVTEKIEVEELKDHIKFLASEKCEGRRPGLKGNTIAAEYIREHYKAIGLKPLAENGFQYFEVTTALKATDNNYLMVDDLKLLYEKDFKPMSISGNGNLKSNAVLVGYGFNISEDSLKWDDYADVDVKGKWVIILRGAPNFKENSELFEKNASLRKKMLTAQNKGAKGILLVHGEKFDLDDSFAAYRNTYHLEIPIIRIKREVANKLIESSDLTVKELENFYLENRKPLSFELDKVVDGNVELKEIKAKTQNVIYYLEGNDPELKNEYVIIGSHYDHLGHGGPGSGSRVPDTNAIHYGADDNASGVAANIELAEKFSFHKNELKRSVIFMAFSGEEMGLLGSKYFVENPLVDLTKVNCMLNLDMVGRLNESKTITLGGTGTAKEFSDLLTNITDTNKIKLKKSPEGYGPSDHASFYTKDIPVLFFFSGIHEDYHTPNDTYDKINYLGEKDIAELVYNLSFTLDTLKTKLTYQESGPKENKQARRAYKVSLGIMPDVTGTSKNGLQVDAVMKGRPAFRAGMKKGDVIIGINNKPVKDIYEYMDRLSELKKGEEIIIKVKRGKEELILKTVL